MDQLVTLLKKINLPVSCFTEIPNDMHFAMQGGVDEIVDNAYRAR